MKSWDDLREREFSDSSLNESRLVRKGLGLAYGAQAKNHGNNAEKHFKQASQELSGLAKGGDIDLMLGKLAKSVLSLSEGLVDTRKQLGSMTAMMNVAILLEERTDQQLKKLSRKSKL